MPLVVSVTVTSVNATVIGGLQSGWNTAVRVRLNSALPFCTGKSPSAETDSLLAALGWLLPGLMHSAVALTTMWTWASSPRPASLPETVRLSPVRVAVTVLLTKCGLPANAGVVMTAIMASASTATRMKRRINVPFLGICSDRVRRRPAGRAHAARVGTGDRWDDGPARHGGENAGA